MLFITLFSFRWRMFFFSIDTMVRNHFPVICSYRLHISYSKMLSPKKSYGLVAFKENQQIICRNVVLICDFNFSYSFHIYRVSRNYPWQPPDLHCWYVPKPFFVWHSCFPKTETVTSFSCCFSNALPQVILYLLTNMKVFYFCLSNL